MKKKNVQKSQTLAKLCAQNLTTSLLASEAIQIIRDTLRGSTKCRLNFLLLKTQLWEVKSYAQGQD